MRRSLTGKNEIVKKMWTDRAGTQEMLWEILEEVNESKQTVKIASTSADKAVVKLIRNTHSQQITSREGVMLIQIGRSAFALARDTCHPFEY
jgi:hypothetical protein